MKLEQRVRGSGDGWKVVNGGLGGTKAQLVLAFGGRAQLEDPSFVDSVRKLYPGAHVIAASTSGEIADTSVLEEQLTTLAIAMEKTELRCAATSVTNASESWAAGRRLAELLAGPDLTHVFVLSDGARVNGTELARGFNEILPPGVFLTGGLAGDGTRFEKTVVGLDETPVSGRIAAAAFYGKHLRVAFGSAGGWTPFGPERIVTKSEGNVLLSLDGKSALQLYKAYLGEQAAQLPGSALRFPLSVITSEDAEPLVRTILSIDEGAQSMTFAGDIPLGARVRFMRASYDDLIDGAARAADQTSGLADPDLVVCVSCVGRRIVLGQRAEEETERVRETIGPRATITGFYSYGELAPAAQAKSCQLHNQTLTITTFRED